MNAAATVAKMSLEEKAKLVSGRTFWHTEPIERLHVPSIMLSDGPHGLRKQGGKEDHLGLNKSVPATCFPPAATLANSWDPQLAYRVGRAIGEEAAEENVRVVLGPGLNIKRSPLGGRNFEYFSEDPLLSGQMAAAMTKGIQSVGVAACPKHFAVNSQEYNRMVVDEIVDERALHEIYLEAFRQTVEASDPWALMSSYNRVNGTYAHENPELLQRTLRDTWGFSGAVVSDWGGTNDRVQSVLAGGSLEMPTPGPHAEAEIICAVEDGRLKESTLDERVLELLTLIERTKEPTTVRSGADANHGLAVLAATESAVLLKNDGALPLSDPTVRTAVIGSFAAEPRYQGAGSSLVNPTRLDDALSHLGAEGIHVIGYEPGFKRLGAPSKRRLRKAIDLAEQAEVILLFLGLDEASEAEARDRRHMHLPKVQLRLAKELIKTGKPIIVVLSAGAPVEMPFADHVSAILHSYLGGQGGGKAVAQLLSGTKNPSGKLAETYPLKYEHTPASPWYLKAEATAEHRESIYVGYRYYDKVGEEVRFPFGHGLSYTDFNYSSLNVTDRQVQFSIQNVGGRAGAEIAQVYVRPHASGFWAPQQLRAFARVELGPGESKRVSADLPGRAFSAYFPGRGWERVAGKYDIAVGASSRDIRLQAPVEVDGVKGPEAPSGNYASGAVHTVTSSQFSELLGRPIPAPEFGTGPLHGNSILAEASTKSFAGKAVAGGLQLTRKLLLALRRPIEANYTYFVEEIPLRSISRMSGGRVSPKTQQAIIDVLNGNYLRGIRSLFGRDGKNQT